MFELFENKSTIRSGAVSYPEFDYIRVSYLRELANIDDYYRNRVYAVKSNHLLINILTHLDVPLSYDCEQYVNVVGVRSPYVAKAFKLTSEINTGEVFHGVFYDPSGDEIIISNTDYFKPSYAEKNWKRISAVQVLAHPRSDMGLLLPNGRKTGTESGLSVVSVNIPLLSLQWRCFQLEQARTGGEKGGYLGAAHFIHMYVLPNMLYSHIDLMVLNRAMNLFYGSPMGVNTFRHPFAVLDYSAKVDRVLGLYNRDANVKRQSYSSLLQMYPSIVAEDLETALLMPELAPTRQVQWAVILARLGVVKFMVDVTGEVGIRSNRGEINYMQRTLKRLRGDGSYRGMLSTDLQYDVEETIDELLAI